ncbi:MAG: DNA polymerase III subunit delta [Moraxellaceae bacterium]|nr:DNA polymerase III subunit delta [Moraxellaceae bacterium]
MNKSFITIYPQLEQNKLSLAGLWFAHGDEPLLNQWLVDGLRPLWQKNGQTVQRIELVSAKTWYEVLAELDSLSLFDPANAIIVTGNHKPDKACQQSLLDFAMRSQNSDEVQSHLLWTTAKQDKRALSAKWIAPFSQHGLIIDCNLYNEQQRQQILQYHAQKFALQLNVEAWQLLMSHTQNNLLNAYQTLWRLSYLTDRQSQIDIKTLQSALVNQSSFTSFDLSDAMLMGDVQKVVKILEVLQNTNEPPTLVLWTIAKDMRLIQQLQAGKNPQEIGIWRSKQTLYFNASQRISRQTTENWAKLLFDCDRAIKGVIQQPIWELLLQSALSVAGVQLFV